jgi:hypothetical protein
MRQPGSCPSCRYPLAALDDNTSDGVALHESLVPRAPRYLSGVWERGLHRRSRATT